METVLLVVVVVAATVAPAPPANALIFFLEHNTGFSKNSRALPSSDCRGLRHQAMLCVPIFLSCSVVSSKLSTAGWYWRLEPAMGNAVHKLKGEMTDDVRLST